MPSPSSNPLAWLTWLNVFQLCARALRVLGHFMVLLVLAMELATLFAVLTMYTPPFAQPSGSVLQSVGGILAALVLGVLVAMSLWSYFAAVVSEPGRVPAGWHPFIDEQQARHELERMAYADYLFDRRDPRRPRYCKRCQGWKPERAHHCSVLGRCVLKMDHYCIWVVNCVGLMNYKFFMLFLFYSLLGCLLATGLLMQPLARFFAGALRGPAAPFVFVVAILDGAFALALAGFLAMHAQLLAAGCTTIEMYEKDRIHPWPYNRGLRRNLEDVFAAAGGRHKFIRMALPMHSKEDKRALLDSCLATRLLPTAAASGSSAMV